MYLVTELRKKTKTGGKGLCEVFYVSNLKTRPGDVTEQVAQKYDFTYKDGYIVVHYGSGNGYMRISEAMRADDKNAPIFAISAFKN